MSGVLPVDKNGYIVSNDFKTQAKYVLNTLLTNLKTLNSDFDNVLNFRVFLSDFASQFDLFNEVWSEFFINAETLPTRSPLTGGPLIPGALLTVDCIAKVRDRLPLVGIPHDTPSKVFQNIMYTSGVVGMDSSDAFEKQAEDALDGLAKVLADQKRD